MPNHPHLHLSLSHTLRQPEVNFADTAKLLGLRRIGLSATTKLLGLRRKRFSATTTLSGLRRNVSFILLFSYTSRDTPFPLSPHIFVNSQV